MLHGLVKAETHLYSAGVHVTSLKSHMGSDPAETVSEPLRKP